MQLVPGFTRAPAVRAMINIGALLDIPTGLWLKGKYKENILNGGLGAITGIVGIGNNFKSSAVTVFEIQRVLRKRSVSGYALGCYRRYCL